MDYNYGKLIDIIKQAYISENKHIKAALDWEENYRCKSDQEIHQIFEELNAIKDDIDHKYLAQKIHQQLDKDQHFIDLLNQNIKLITAQNCLNFNNNEITWSLKLNKLSTIFPTVKNLLNLHSVENFLEDNLPDDYGLNIQNIPLLNSDNNTIYGNSKTTFLKTTLLYLKNTAAKITNKIQTFWKKIDNSAIAHLISLPTKFKPENFEECSFYSNQIYDSHSYKHSNIEGLLRLTHLCN